MWNEAVLILTVDKARREFSSRKKSKILMTVTIKDVARRAGVSIQTVSNVLNRRVNVRPQTRSKVLKASEELNYMPNAIARSLVTRKTKAIGLIITNIRNPIYGDVVASINEVAERYGYSVIVGNTQRDSVSEQRIVNLLFEQRVDGVLLASGTWDSSATELLHSARIPVVRFLSHPQTLNTDFFGADDCEGTRIATNHLIGLGHVDIGFVTGPKSSISLQREQGFRDAMRAAELKVNDQWIVDGAFLREGAYNAGVQLLRKKSRPSAMVCASDLMAIGLIDAAYDFALKVPEDLAVTGFDDIFAASMRQVNLTTIKFDLEGIAESAILRLINKMSSETAIRDRKYVTAPCKLIIRGSCGASLKGAGD
jgi:DNA-binding LacI/PurR family transcriptional regulator